MMRARNEYESKENGVRERDGGDIVHVQSRVLGRTRREQILWRPQKSSRLYQMCQTSAGSGRIVTPVLPVSAGLGCLSAVFMFNSNYEQKESIHLEPFMLLKVRTSSLLSLKSDACFILKLHF